MGKFYDDFECSVILGNTIYIHLHTIASTYILAISTYFPVQSGVHQGWILSSSLFLTVINWIM